jgi:hypothetical protein
LAGKMKRGMLIFIVITIFIILYVIYTCTSFGVRATDKVKSVVGLAPSQIDYPRWASDYLEDDDPILPMDPDIVDISYGELEEYGNNRCETNLDCLYSLGDQLEQDLISSAIELNRWKIVNTIKLYNEKMSNLELKHDAAREDTLKICNVYHTVISVYEKRITRLEKDGIDMVGLFHSLKDLHDRPELCNILCRIIFAFAKSYKTCKRGFLNFIICGSPGSGKSRATKIMGKVLCMCGIRATDKVVVLNSRNLVSKWVGDTRLKTHDQFVSAMEGVFVIDEAHNLNSQEETGRDTFGKQAMDELVFLTDLYSSYVSVVAAGYVDKMKINFLGGDAGMERRFPYQVLFERYPPMTLYKICLEHIIGDFEWYKADHDILYTMIMKNENNFHNQAGDAVQFAVIINRTMYLPGYEWNEGGDNIHIFTHALDEFMQNRVGYSHD